MLDVRYVVRSLLTLSIKHELKVDRTTHSRDIVV